MTASLVKFMKLSVRTGIQQTLKRPVYCSSSTSIQNLISNNGYCTQYDLQSHCRLANTFIQIQQHLRGQDLSSRSFTKQHKPSAAETSEILANLSPDDDKKLKMIKLEYQIFYEARPRLSPEVLTDHMCLHCLELNTPSARRKYYVFMDSIRKSKECASLKKVERRELMMERIKEQDYVTINQRCYISPKHLRNIHYLKASFISSMQFGPHIVFDMDFEDIMTDRERKNTLSQIEESHGVNKLSKEPFHVCFTNLKPDGMMVPRMCDGNLHQLYTLTDQSYLDLFPKDRLVYLSPDAGDELTSFNYDDVYIIGGMVDLSSKSRLTLAKAKKDGIRCVKFPVDKYLVWQKGNKTLALNQVLNIMLILKDTNNWLKALEVIPRRKILDIKPAKHQQQKKIRKQVIL